jgi:hypothetical protein
VRIARLAGRVVLATTAASLAVASPASAAPLFSPASGTFKGESSTTDVIKASVNEVACKKDTISGTIDSSMSVGEVVIHFLECTSSGESKSGCEVSGVGGVTGKGLLFTTTLKGNLGNVLPGTLPGLLLLPASGKTFLTLAKNECTAETKLTGLVGALIAPITGGGTTGQLIFQSFNKGEFVKAIATLGGLIEPLLGAFGAIATENMVDDLTYSQSMEVM